MKPTFVKPFEREIAPREDEVCEICGLGKIFNETSPPIIEGLQHRIKSRF